MIKACVIFNYNSYYRINISDSLKLRTLFQTLPYIVCRKPSDVLYMIFNGQILGADPKILDHSMNMLGLAEGRCTIHMIFKIPNEAYSYTHNDLLASYNALNYPVMVDNALSTQANRLLIQTMLNPNLDLDLDSATHLQEQFQLNQLQLQLQLQLQQASLDVMTVTTSRDRIAEILEDVKVEDEDVDEENDPTCVICSQTGGTWAKLTVCGHIFHRECITDWLSSFSTKCPVCDEDVRL